MISAKKTAKIERLIILKQLGKILGVRIFTPFYGTVPYRTIPYLLFHRERKVVGDLPLSVSASSFVPLR
jgi:hypothetical protein